ncbi:MAG: GNAT family N-acetyltransferase [Chloroflexi bacterium]|nr:GNAT family N-acetyltransferase [Chloroflexota bacterium]
MVNVEIRELMKSDIDSIVASFAQLGWNKLERQYRAYFAEQKAGERLVLIGILDGGFVGYLTIVWKSAYDPFRKEEIPEIMDLNVLPKYRRQGIATQLMDGAEEKIANRHRHAGLGIGMTADYGAAQRLYVLRGYLPDGQGLAYDGKTLDFGDNAHVDDSLTLYFTKVLVPGLSNVQ